MDLASILNSENVSLVNHMLRDPKFLADSGMVIHMLGDGLLALGLTRYTSKFKQNLLEADKSFELLKNQPDFKGAECDPRFEEISMRFFSERGRLRKSAFVNAGLLTYLPLQALAYSLVFGPRYF